jgi:uncharacterized protein (DUF433 family)
LLFLSWQPPARAILCLQSGNPEMQGYNCQVFREARDVSKEYVTQVHGAYRISGTRVSLDSVVYAFLNGVSPESIQDSFPVLTLEQVYGAIAYYLAHQPSSMLISTKERRNLLLSASACGSEIFSCIRNWRLSGTRNEPSHMSLSQLSHESPLSG